MAGKPHPLLRPIISSVHGRVVVYWALVLLAVYLFREPQESTLVLIRGAVPQSTAVAPFLPPDSSVLIKNPVVIKKKAIVQKKTAHTNRAAIYLNSANASELCQIKGIGPVLAGRIIQYRNDNGKFSSIDELEGVKGIGPKTVAKLKSQAIRVGR